MEKNRKRKTSSDVYTFASDGRKANELDYCDDAKNHKDEVEFKNNPLYREQQSFLSSITTKERNFYFSQSTDSITPQRRAEIWMNQAEIGEALVNKYAWATPTNDCLRIFREFSPIVEIGSGSNAYWARYMIGKAGINVVAYDMNPQEGGKIHSNRAVRVKKSKCNEEKSKSSLVLRKGGPEVLKLPELQNHTLFLCYPDEEDLPAPGDEQSNFQDGGNGQPLSFGWQCLSEYEGKYVIHVGELAVLGDATLNMEQSPWGRSSSPEFQQRLASEFHCIAKVYLPNWLHVRDSISVWKRSEICQMTFVDDDEEEEDEEIIEYRHIPLEERLPQNIIAPCMAHVLTPYQLPKTKSTPLSTCVGGENKTVAIKTPKEDSKNIASTTTDKKADTCSKGEVTEAKSAGKGTSHNALQSSKTKRALRRERQKQKKKLSMQHSSSQKFKDECRNKMRKEKKMRSDYFRLHGTLPSHY